MLGLGLWLGMVLCIVLYKKPTLHLIKRRYKKYLDTLYRTGTVFNQPHRTTQPGHPSVNPTILSDNHLN